MSSNDKRETLMSPHDRRAELVRLLDICGADDTRWSPAVGERIRTLAADVPDAKAVLEQARAVDRLLDATREYAPTSPNHAALADRILAAALATTPDNRTQNTASAGADVIRLDAKQRDRQTPSRRGPLPASRTVPRWQQTGALLAASLLIGIIVGGSFDFEPIVRDLAGASSSTAEFEATAMALGGELGGEDAL